MPWRLRPLFALAVLAAAAGVGLLAGNTSASQAATKYSAFAGGGGGGIAVETFRPNVIFINEGDTVEWTNPYEEIHTVTFFAGGEEPPLIIPIGPPTPPGVAPPPGPPKLQFNPKAALPQGGNTYDGTAFVGSGILNKGQSFNVTFPKRGQYQFDCVIHPGMEGTVYVLAPNIFVPSQAQRDAEANAQLQQDLGRANAAAAAVSAPAATTNANGTKNWNVVNAPSVGQADIMKFFPSRVQVGVGDTVTWTNNTEVPHTITFGDAAPSLVIPQPQPAGPPVLQINPSVLFPVKTGPTYDGTGYVNSGFITADTVLATGGTTFSLTFTKPGTYLYVCALHFDQGMAGTIVVGEAAAGGGGVVITPPSTGDAGLAGAGLAMAGWQTGMLVLSLLVGLGAMVAMRSRSSA